MLKTIKKISTIQIALLLSAALMSGCLLTKDPIFSDEQCGEIECGEINIDGDTYNCGVCPGASQYCSEDGKCIDDCESRQCGVSPLGYSCGTCSASEYCSPDFHCENGCAQRECGPSIADSTLSCGVCPGAFDVCNTGGQCEVSCPNHWEGVHCDVCPGNFDAQKECNQCAGYWQGAQCDTCPENGDIIGGCLSCLTHWEGDACDVCPGNWDATQNCDVCRNHWSGPDCTVCPETIDANSDCSKCQEGWTGSQCTLKQDRYPVPCASWTALKMTADWESGKVAVIYSTNSKFMYFHCVDDNCTSLKQEVLATGTYEDIDIAFTNDGLPVMSYTHGWYDAGIILMTCDDVACSAPVETELRNAYASDGTAIAIGANGFPVIATNAYNYDVAGLVLCEDATCSSSSIYILEECGDYGCGDFSDMVIDGNGNPAVLFEYSDWGPDFTYDHHAAICAEPSCEERTVLNVLPSSTSFPASIALNAEGNPMFVIKDGDSGVALMTCDKGVCDKTQVSPLPRMTQPHVILLGADGNPIIAYGNKVVDCKDTRCTSYDEVEGTSLKVTRDIAAAASRLGTHWAHITKGDDSTCYLEILLCPDDVCR